MRMPFLTLIIGTNGTGKSSLIKNKFIPNELNNNGKVLIVLPDDADEHWINLQTITKISDFKNFKTGIRKIIYVPGAMQVIRQNYKNGLLIFDDFRGLDIEKKAEIEALRKIAIRRRQAGLDIIIVAHGVTDIIPGFLIRYASHIILFMTLDNIASHKQFFLNYELIRQKQSIINEKAKQNPHYYQIIQLRSL